MVRIEPPLSSRLRIRGTSNMKRNNSLLVLRALGPTTMCLTLGYALLRLIQGLPLNILTLGAMCVAAILVTLAAWWPRPDR